MIQIELANANDFVTQITLDTIIYNLHFAWSGTRWTFDIRDSDNNDLIRGLALVPNFPILLPHRRTLNGLKGQFIAVVNNGVNIHKFDRNDFVEGKAKFVYIPWEEIEALKNG